MAYDSPHPTGRLARDRKEAGREGDTRSSVVSLRSLYIHALVYCVVNGVLLAIGQARPVPGHWSIYPLLVWGLVLAMHGVAVWKAGLFRQAGEDREVRELMDKDRRDDAGQAGPATPTQEHGSNMPQDGERRD